MQQFQPLVVYLKNKTTTGLILLSYKEAILMNAEILCVGTELLLGNIVNTNAAYLSDALAGLGINVYYHTVVGDNQERLKKALAIAFDRSDLVITTGGLGPTYDDLTKETIAQYFGLPLAVHDDSLSQIKSFFAQHTEKMMANNEKQALMPQGATVFANLCGTAPGCAISKDGKTAIMLPGPPSEMQMMFEHEAKPYLAKLSDHTLVSRTVHLCGIGESTTESMLKEMMVKNTNHTIAPYAKGGEVELRITAAAPDEAKGKAMIEPILADIQKMLGQYIYGIDVGSLQQAVVNELTARGQRVATAESCTGGLISKSLTDIPGSSQVFAGGVCAYTNDVKVALLGVRPETLERYTAVSEQTAREMAEGVRQALHTDYAVSTTGIAGPDGGTAEQPVGLVYVAIAGPQTTRVEKLQISVGTVTTRDTVRNYAAKRALYFLWQMITQG